LSALLACGWLWCQIAPVFRADVDLVVVPCSVTDEHGAALADLSAADFRIYDNGVPQPVRNFALERDLPLTLGVMIDASASQRTFLQAHRDAARRFLERVIRPQDHAFVVEVAEAAILRSEVTGGPYGLREHLMKGAEPLGDPCPTLRGRSICGGTALWEGVYAAASLKLQPATGSKALVILSDGNDTGSIHKIGAVIEGVQRADAVAYAVEYPDPLSGVSSESLGTLAHQTGGVVFNPGETSLAEALERVATDLRSRYVLGFQPPASGLQHGEHQLRVEVSRPGAIVRARTGYFKDAQ
jgi:Ca-activated chloride channel family protein